MNEYITVVAVPATPIINNPLNPSMYTGTYIIPTIPTTSNTMDKRGRTTADIRQRRDVEISFLKCSYSERQMQDILEAARTIHAFKFVGLK